MRNRINCKQKQIGKKEQNKRKQQQKSPTKTNQNKTTKTHPEPKKTTKLCFPVMNYFIKKLNHWSRTALFPIARSL